MKKSASLDVNGTVVRMAKVNGDDYICLTDMLKAKDGEFFITDWLRNRNTLEYVGIWERVYNPDFNYGEFATIKSQSNDGIPQPQRLKRLNEIAIHQMKVLTDVGGRNLLT